MTMATDSNHLELDNFVSPNAATDVPDDDFIALDMTPTAMPEVTSEVTATPSTDDGLSLVQALAAIVTPVTSTAPTTFGSIRREGFIAPTGNDRTFDSSPLTRAEIAERDANRAATLARQAARQAIAARPGGHAEDAPDAPMLADFDGSIVVESITEKLHGLSLHYGECQIARHTLARDILIDLLTTNGFEDCIPAIRSGNAQLRKVMNSLNSQIAREDREDDLRLRTWNVTERDCDRLGMEWPANLDSRWNVGLLDATDSIGTMGDKVLVVSLVRVTAEDGSNAFEVQFTGGTRRMQQAVTNRFNALYGTSALNVTELIAWYKTVLVKKFGAIKQGFKLLIPGNDSNQDNMRRAERFMQVLQGADIYGPSPIMGRRLDCDKVTSRTGATWDAFCLNVGAGMVEDVRSLGLEFGAALKIAQDRALVKAQAKEGSTPADHELAVRRAVIGSDRENSAARGLMARLTALAGRARDSVSLIGRTHATAAINACEALRSEWIGKCHADSTSSMMAEIELD